MMFENPQSDVENAPEPELGEKIVYDIPERCENTVEPADNVETFSPGEIDYADSSLIPVEPEIDTEAADAELAEQRLNADDGHYLSHAEVFPHDEEGPDPEPTLDTSTAVEVSEDTPPVRTAEDVLNDITPGVGELSFDDASILASEGGDIARRSWANPHAFLRFVNGELMFCVDHKPQMREYTVTQEDDAATDWYVFDIPETAED